MGTALTKAERFSAFLERLLRAAPCTSLEEAFRLVSTTLNAVEDEFTSIPFDPASFRSDGRMYPPQGDSVREVKGRDDVRRYRSAGHNTYIGRNCAIRIDVVRGECVLSKPGLDGRTIDLEEPAPAPVRKPS